MKLFAFTLDLESDYAGLMNEYNILRDLVKIEEFLSALNSLDVKITAFTVGEMLEQFPKVIKTFEKYKCEFEPHSYSHDFNNPDSETEIKKAKRAYLNYFNKNPFGYRAPRGKITRSGIKKLEKYGFLYDSSIFPSYFPNPFLYLFSNREIHYYKNSSIVEIPFTSISPFRVTLSISYIKLLGIDFFVKQALPNIICFGSHLHDFIHSNDSFNKLPLVWKLIYSRNKLNGIDYCIKFLTHVKKEGYQFCYLSELYNLYKNKSLYV